MLFLPSAVLDLPHSLAMIGLPGGVGEWLIIAAFGLLLFGKRLPEVGKSLGRSIVEFKKGLKGVEDDIEVAASAPGQPATLPPGTKYDPYTGKPLGETVEAEDKAS